MISIKNKESCSGCYACCNSCPLSCIHMIPDDEGFLYPKVDQTHCIDCGLCEKNCPNLKPSFNINTKTSAIAAVNQNEEIRLRSSSGGVFTLLAESIISSGGVVFGAAFSDDFGRVIHICVDDITDLDKLRGSKYVQSEIGDSYKQAKSYLDSGRKVLFTGTPCQISGLYSFLNSQYSNLYTQDIICHGVPSPLVWRKYLNAKEKQANSKTQKVSFRNKKHGWKSYMISILFENGNVYNQNMLKDTYMRAFLANVCLRPSCYNCQFKGVNRPADITLADFWGIQYLLKEMDDDKGTSIVLIHSTKGQRLIDDIKNYMKSVVVNVDSIKAFNKSLEFSSSRSANRCAFLKRISDEDFDEVVDHLLPIPIKTRVSLILSRIGLGGALSKIKLLIRKSC